MKKINFYAILLVSIVTINQIRAQFGMGKPEDIEQVKKRGIIVIVEKPSERIIKKLTKKGKTTEMDAYKAAIAEYNSNMQAVAEKFWNFSSGKIEYKTIDEVKKTANRKNMQ